MHSSELKKIEYYKQRIIKTYLDNSSIIDKIELEKKIAEIDTKIAIFQQQYIYSGSTMDVDILNRQKKEIYNDLHILYKTLYDLLNTKLAKLKSKVEYNLNNIKNIAKKYEERLALETAAIFGETIFLKTTGIKQTYLNGRIIIDIGSISIDPGSYILCLLKSDHIEQKNIKFQFNDNLIVSSYYYNKDMIKISENVKTNTIEYISDIINTGSFAINIDKKISNKSLYYFYAGKNEVKFIPNGNSKKYVKIKNDISNVFIDSGEISFYVYNASKISFSCSNSLINKNFDGHEINNPQKCQKIYMKFDKNFVFDIETDGDIYAERSKCIIDGNKLISVNGYPTVSFMIEEISQGEPIKFDNAKVIIENSDTTAKDIDVIAIKQITIGDYYDNL